VGCVQSLNLSLQDDNDRLRRDVVFFSRKGSFCFQLVGQRFTTAVFGKSKLSIPEIPEQITKDPNGGGTASPCQCCTAEPVMMEWKG